MAPHPWIPDQVRNDERGLAKKPSIPTHTLSIPTTIVKRPVRIHDQPTNAIHSHGNTVKTQRRSLADRQEQRACQKMKYRNLGKSGLEVSEVGLGCNNFGRRWDYERAKTIVGGALDNGINFLDTADVYSDGESESIIGRALHGLRDQVVIGTKFAGAMGEGPNSSGGSRKYLIDALDASLRRLQTDYVDLYQMHGPDRSTPIHETLRALDDMVTAGKVRYIGCSNFPGWEIVDAVWTSRTERLAHFVSCQPPYNILDRGIEAEILPACRRYGLGILPYYPLASGFLTGKYGPGGHPTRRNEAALLPEHR